MGFDAHHVCFTHIDAPVPCACIFDEVVANALQFLLALSKNGRVVGKEQHVDEFVNEAYVKLVISQREPRRDVINEDAIEYRAEDTALAHTSLDNLPGRYS